MAENVRIIAASVTLMSTGLTIMAASATIMASGVLKIWTHVCYDICRKYVAVVAASATIRVVQM